MSATGAIPGKFLVDVLPWLKYVPEWVPGASFQRLAREWKEVWRELKKCHVPDGSGKYCELETQLLMTTDINHDSRKGLLNIPSCPLV